MSPDINVLVAASRADHVHHRPAIAWLNGAIARCERGGSLAVLPMVTAGYLRLVTNPRVFPDPTPTEAAIAFLDSLFSTPGVEVLTVGGEWLLLRGLLIDKALRGNDLPDAWIAAAIRAHGGHLVTFDRGFAKLLNKREVTILAPAL
jgi:toxin-antitoxin system PIN domain toxin